MMSESDCWALIRDYHRRMLKGIDEQHEGIVGENMARIEAVLEVINGG